MELPSPYPGGKPASIMSRLGNALRLSVLYASVLYLRLYFRIELFHFQFCVTTYEGLFRILKFHRWPFLITFHGSDVNYHFSKADRASLFRDMSRNASRLVTVSSALRDKLLQQIRIDPAKVSVIGNTVSVQLWNIVVEEGRAPKFSDSPRIAFIGRLEPVKDPCLLVRAFHDVVAHFPKACLLIAGDGSLERDVRELVATLQLEQNVEFLGVLDRDAVVELLSSVQVVAMPSQNEGLPLVAMEAQIFGVPVVATRVGGLPEIVRDGQTGLLVPAGDADLLGSALIKVLSDRALYEHLSEKARSFALRTFNPGDMAAKYAALYSEITSVPK